MSSPKEYWNKYYTEHPFKDQKEPSPFLVSMKPRLQKGKVLDIGMGEGSNAVYLALQGFQVKGFDLSSVAIERAQKLAADSGVKIDAAQTDLDMYLMGLLEYDSIIMTKFKPNNKRYYSEILRALKQGGTLLIESYTLEEMGEAIGPDESYRNYFFANNEVLQNVAGMRMLFYNESKDEQGRHFVQCLAQKPIDRDAAKYSLFDMHTSSNKKEGMSKQLELAEKLFKK